MKTSNMGWNCYFNVCLKFLVHRNCKKFGYFARYISLKKHVLIRRQTYSWIHNRCSRFSVARLTSRGRRKYHHREYAEDKRNRKLAHTLLTNGANYHSSRTLSDGQWRRLYCYYYFYSKQRMIDRAEGSHKRTSFVWARLITRPTYASGDIH